MPSRRLRSAPSRRSPRSSRPSSPSSKPSRSPAVRPFSPRPRLEPIRRLERTLTSTLSLAQGHPSSRRSCATSRRTATWSGRPSRRRTEARFVSLAHSRARSDRRLTSRRRAGEGVVLAATWLLPVVRASPLSSPDARVSADLELNARRRSSLDRGTFRSFRPPRPSARLFDGLAPLSSSRAHRAVVPRSRVPQLLLSSSLRFSAAVVLPQPFSLPAVSFLRSSTRVTCHENSLRAPQLPVERVAEKRDGCAPPAG